jgi:hypothetical protein
VPGPAAATEPPGPLLTPWLQATEASSQACPTGPQVPVTPPPGPFPGVAAGAIAISKPSLKLNSKSGNPGTQPRPVPEGGQGPAARARGPALLL